MLHSPPPDKAWPQAYGLYQSVVFYFFVDSMWSQCVQLERVQYGQLKKGPSLYTRVCCQVQQCRVGLEHNYVIIDYYAQI